MEMLYIEWQTGMQIQSIYSNILMKFLKLEPINTFHGYLIKFFDGNDEQNIFGSHIITVQYVRLCSSLYCTLRVVYIVYVEMHEKL